MYIGELCGMYIATALRKAVFHEQKWHHDSRHLGVCLRFLLVASLQSFNLTALRLFVAHDYRHHALILGTKA